MIRLREMMLYFATAAFTFFLVSFNMWNINEGGSDQGTDSILALIFIYETALLVMSIIKNGRVRENYDPEHLRFARKLLRAAETVYVVIVLHIILSFPRIVVFFYTAKEEPLRALKNALFIPWVLELFSRKTGYVESRNMAFAWILAFLLAITVLMYIAISKYYNAKKLAALLENRSKKNRGNVFQTQADIEEAAMSEKQTEPPELSEVAEEADLIPDEEEFRKHLHQISDLGFTESSSDKKKPELIEETKDVDFNPDEEVDLIPDEEEFKRHLHQIPDLNAADSRTDKEQRECPFCGSINDSENKQCSFCGAELEQ